MCGIAGISCDQPAPWARRLIGDMTASLAHRGPDSDGTFASPDDNVHLGFRRLAIRDLDFRANQPMASASGQTSIVFNGEIYNTADLAAKFCPDVNWRTTGDTEVLLETFERHGKAFLPECNGMFAAAFYELSNSTLTLARDRMGKKPLYLYEGDGFVAFASELRAFGPLGLEPDPSKAPYFFHFGYLPSPHTFFKRVSQVCPGEIAFIRRGTIVSRWRYHRFSELDWGGGQSCDDKSMEQLDRLFSDAVSIRTQSDVPVGVFLSGGVDSSLVAAQLGGESDRTLPTFTVSFDESRYDEGPQAAEMAATLKLPNTQIRIAESELPTLLSDYLDCYEQPYADSSGFPTMVLCREVKKYVTVVLSGDGGDEFFGGYDRYDWYRTALHAQHFPSSLRGILKGLVPKIDRRRGPRIKRLLEAQGEADLYARLIRMWTADGPLSELLPDIPDADTAPSALVEDLFGRLRCDALSKAACFDATYYIPDDLQVKMDRASMQVALEVRCPLLDSRIAAFGATLSKRVKYRDGKKSVLKALLARHVARRLVDRPKRGFGIPLAEWLKGPLRADVHDALFQQAFRECGWLSTSKVASIVRQFENGRLDLAAPIWMLLVMSRSISAAERPDRSKDHLQQATTRRVA